MIKVSSLSHQIGGQSILHDINLEIPKGKVTALIGPNGAGKSTLLSLIARLARYHTGQIWVDDLEVGRYPSNTLARRLAILPQEVEIAPRLSVQELVSFGRYPHHRGRPVQEDVAKVSEAIGLFDLQALASRPLDTLSGGQRQRALLAMIFAQSTDYILLDEPLNNLDIAASRALMALVREFCDRHGRTVVAVLHDINYASAYADHIITMKDGRLGPQGAPLTLITQAMIEEIFGAKTDVFEQNGKVTVAV